MNEIHANWYKLCSWDSHSLIILLMNMGLSIIWTNVYKWHSHHLASQVNDVLFELIRSYNQGNDRPMNQSPKKFIKVKHWQDLQSIHTWKNESLGRGLQYIIKLLMISMVWNKKDVTCTNSSMLYYNSPEQRILAYKQNNELPVV